MATKKRIRIKQDHEIEQNQKVNRQKKIQLLDSLREQSIVNAWSNDNEQTTELGLLRINRFLAKCGLGSRRNVEALVEQGEVVVNNQVITNLGQKINPITDIVSVNGQIVQPIEQDLIIAFNKPAGYLCSHMDVHHEKTVFNLLPIQYRRLNMAGRLDLNSRGLMIFASDGGLIHKLSHPSRKIFKQYRVQVDKLPAKQELIQNFLAGIEDNGEILHAKDIEVLDAKENLLQITLGEGRKRQIRRMLLKLGARVKDLQRVAIGRLHLSSLAIAEGEFAHVQVNDIFIEGIH